MLLGNHIEEGAGVKAENWFNRTLVFAAGNGVGLVVIHVAGGDDENAAAMCGDRFRHSKAQLFECCELSGAERDWNERKVRLENLQEGQLNFRSMLGAVCGCIFEEKRTALLQNGCEIACNGYWAERRFPDPFAHDGEGTAQAGVVGTQYDAEFRNFQSGKDGAGDMAGIHVARMGDQASHGGDGFLRRSLREISENVFAEHFWIAGVETSGDSGTANWNVGSSRVDLQACKLEYSIVSPK